MVFAVARHACTQRHPDPHAENLFKLNPVTEDQLDALLAEHLGETLWWQAIFSRLEAVVASDEPGPTLLKAEVVSNEDLSAVADCDLGPDGRSLVVPNDRPLAQIVGRLAAGFARSGAGSLVVPYLAEAR